MQLLPFSVPAQGYQIAVTSTASTSQALPSKGNTMRLVNEGPNHCYVSIGTGTQTATTPGVGVASKTATSVVVLAGTDVTFSVPDVAVALGTFTQTPLNISAICAGTGTATLDVYSGEGI